VRPAAAMVFSYFGAIVFVYASSSVVLSLSPEEAAVNELNAAFDGFDVNKDDSPLGVTLRWQSPNEFKFWCGEGCLPYYGADCRTSAALYNHMIQWQGKYVTPPFAAPNSGGGIVFKPTAVQTMLARCAYMTDAATNERLNHGCGCVADSYESACKNTDPSSGKAYNGSSPDVARCHCATDPKEPETTACYYKGPAFNDGRKNNELQRFVSNRVRQPFVDFPNVFTEVVLDSAVINAHLKKDMSNVITALFIVPSKCDAHCKAKFLMWRDQIAQQYASEPLPVVGVELTANKSPFHVLPSEGESSTARNSPQITV